MTFFTTIDLGPVLFSTLEPFFMHELPVTESILEIALRHAEHANAHRITKIHLVIGQLASIVDDSVQFYWEYVSEGTIAQGATLEFRRIQTRFECKDCGLKFSPAETDYACPDCRSIRVRVINGQEFFVEAIDVENSGSGSLNE